MNKISSPTIKMTPALFEALKRVPGSGWFTKHDVPFVDRADYQLDRLEKAGKLISRIVGDIPDLTREYKKL